MPDHEESEQRDHQCDRPVEKDLPLVRHLDLANEDSAETPEGAREKDETVAQRRAPV